MRRAMTPNQIVAYNLARARAKKGWTQTETTLKLRDYLGSTWSAASYSAIERSVAGTRVKQFNADELVAIARAFELPMAWFFVPPPAAEDIGLAVPDSGGVNGLDPLVLLDVLLGTPETIHHLEEALAEYTAGEVPPVRRKRNKQPDGLVDRLGPLAQARARSVIEATLGDLGQVRAFLDRLQALIDQLEQLDPDAIPAPTTNRRSGADSAEP